MATHEALLGAAICTTGSAIAAIVSRFRRRWHGAVAGGARTRDAAVWLERMSQLQSVLESLGVGAPVYTADFKNDARCCTCVPDFRYLESLFRDDEVCYETERLKPSVTGTEAIFLAYDPPESDAAAQELVREMDVEDDVRAEDGPRARAFVAFQDYCSDEKEGHTVALVCRDHRLEHVKGTTRLLLMFTLCWMFRQKYLHSADPPYVDLCVGELAAVPMYESVGFRVENHFDMVLDPDRFEDAVLATIAASASTAAASTAAAASASTASAAPPPQHVARPSLKRTASDHTLPPAQAPRRR